jgi:hypothetical protein
MKREKRQVKNSNKAQQLYEILIGVITRTAAVGQIKLSWEIEVDDDEDSYACDAEVETALATYSGSYSGYTGIHAEMAALANFVNANNKKMNFFNDIQEIRITKPTCPRCAYVLKSLSLDTKVRYPKGTDLGNRKGPGWTMPSALKTECWYMEPMEGVIDRFEEAGYSRDEGFDFVIRALQTA